MVPSAYRGKRNKPAYLVETAKFIAELREEPLEEVSEVLFNNAKTIFDIE